MEFIHYLLPEDSYTLEKLDWFLHAIHLSLVAFVVFSVFSRRLIPYHFPVLVVIWFCWIVLGLAVGHLGYCPLTDWHWQVKWREGQVNLPPSYIGYCYNYVTGQKVDDKVIANITAGVMVIVTCISGYRFFFWWRDRRRVEVL